MTEPTATDDTAFWAIRLEEGQLSAKDQERLDAWLGAAPHHAGALIRARAVWRNLDRVSALERPRRAIAGEAAAPRSERAAPAEAGSARRGIRWAAALAASIVGVTLALFALKAALFSPDDYATRIGEVRRIALEDGSAITLNSDSRAVVRFEKAQRVVTLERGEALFEVAKDKSRPFMVWSGRVSVRAVGTVFEVRAWPNDVSVAVTEGTVEVAEPQLAPRRVTVNQRATVQASRVIDIAPEDEAVISRQLSWRSGLLSFSGESLGEAVREVNRYSKRQIEIDDPALAAKPVVGIFRIGDVDAFAQAAAVALHAEVHADRRVIRLTGVQP